MVPDFFFGTELSVSSRSSSTCNILLHKVLPLSHPVSIMALATVAENTSNGDPYSISSHQINFEGTILVEILGLDGREMYISSPDSI